jgi:serine/threonine protein kinase
MYNNNNNTLVLLHHKYELKQCIGQGKFGKVFLGQNIHTNSPVAIKTEAKEISLLKREATFLRYLHDRGASKYIPTLLWFGVSQDQPSLVMSYCAGGPLTQFSDDKAVECISALEAIHKLQVIHRDVKPQNFMLNAHYKIQLIDFGLAEFSTEINAAEEKTTILGTPRYASIFVHLGKPHTYRDDMISLGYVFLHLLTNGEYPRRPQQQQQQQQPQSTEIQPESIHHPTNIEIAKTKTLENLKTSGCPTVIQYLENLYRTSPSSPPIDYRKAKQIFQPI